MLNSQFYQHGIPTFDFLHVHKCFEKENISTLSANKIVSFTFTFNNETVEIAQRQFLALRTGLLH